MIVAIHQPEYLPWLGLLAKIKQADVHVLLDDVQFNRASLQHRAKIAPPPASTAVFSWLTIPFVHRHPQLIRDVEIADPAWPSRHVDRLRAAYERAPHFKYLCDLLMPIYDAPRERKVAAVAAATIAVCAGAYAIPFGSVVRSSTLGTAGHRGDKVLAICRELGATTYLSGHAGASYLDRAAFAAAGIEIAVQAFTPPVYRSDQPQTPCVAAIDALAYLGPKASELLR